MTMIQQWEYIATLLALAVIVWLADRKFPILRDIPVNNALPNQPRSYSLARVQMAMWLIIVIGTIAFAFGLCLCLKAPPVIDASLITLLGGSGLTAILAGTVDVSKDKTVEDATASFRGAAAETRAINAQLVAALTAQNPAGAPAPNMILANKLFSDRAAKLTQMSQFLKTGLRSQRDATMSGFISDLLTDQNGNSLHRLQLILFTFLYGLYFIFHALCTGVDAALTQAVPAQILGLMGVSGGVYVGFKVPGKAADASTPPTQST